ncbi:response regulator [Amycolatopsis sp. NPDC005961]|uniref:response regulator n=1 Tax=Amycolatopsis sp. NPDC005961 TaxID=3156720 RepID=UPI00340ACBF4
MTAFDLIIVDDDLEFAEELKDFLEGQLGLTATVTADPNKALQVVKDDGVKIAILDQRMAPMTGLELGRNITATDKRVKNVLLSGQATVDDVTTAWNTIFAKYVHKNNAVSSLPGIIANLLIRYNQELAASMRELQSRPHRVRSRRWPLGSVIEYQLLSIDEVDRDYHFPDNWSTRDQIDAGVTRKKTVTVTWKRSQSQEFELSFKESIGATLSTSALAKLQGSLSADVTQREKLSQTFEESATVVHETTISLPDEPANPTELHVKTRCFQVAPVYIRAAIIVAATCRSCRMKELMKTTLYLPRPALATRHFDTYSNGDTRTVLTGIVGIT